MPVSVFFAGGSSRRLVAKALYTATASTAAQRAVQPAHAAARTHGGASVERSRASARISWRASGPHLPPTSTATTTSLHRRAAVNSGYRRRLRSSACWAARPGSVRVRG